MKKSNHPLGLDFYLPMSEDNVNSPDHYTMGGHEAVKVIESKLSPEQFQGYLLGNILKYTMRCNYKEKFEEDLKKAQWYLNKLVDTFPEEDEN